jgi:hypothetical protein
MRIILTCVVTLLLENPGVTQVRPQPINSSTKSPISGYDRLAGQLNVLIAQTAPPRQIQDALESSLRAGLLQRGDGNRPAIRAETARTVLTNLFLLEKGLRQTSVATNTELRPPVHMSLPFGVGIEAITDPVEREEMIAYSAALKPLGELWNMHQALQAEYRRHWAKAVDAIAEPYALSPERGSELKGLLAPYAGTEFARELSRRVHLKE